MNRLAGLVATSKPSRTYSGTQVNDFDSAEPVSWRTAGSASDARSIAGNHGGVCATRRELDVDSAKVIAVASAEVAPGVLGGASAIRCARTVASVIRAPP